MFGRTLFNKTRYNVTAPFLGLYVNIQSWYELETAKLSALVSIGETNLSAEFDTESGSLSVKIPLPAVEFESRFDVEDVFGLKAPIGDVSTESMFAVEVPALKNDETEEFSLENVFLAPGDVLIIDTDKLEIQLNDENMLEAWVTGGVFFQLKPGTNTIQIETNPEACSLAVTILWADRYL